MITIKTKEEIKIMGEGGKILAKIVKEVKKMAKPGVSTKELDRAAEALILNYGAKPVFKGFDNFPAVICTSVNTQMVHSVPSDYVLKAGDILTLDLGLEYKGFCSDMAITFGIGKINPEAEKLIKATKKSLEIGIKKLKPGNTFGDVGNAIQQFIESCGFSVIRELCGHGIGRELHEEPKILNYGEKRGGGIISSGMVVCLEPMVAMGGWKLKKSQDGFGYEMADNSLCAHFEHTVAIAKKGPNVLTKNR